MNFLIPRKFETRKELNKIKPLTCERAVEGLRDLLRVAVLEVASGRVGRHSVIDGSNHGADGRRILLFVNVVADHHRVELGLGRDRPESAPILDSDLGADLGNDGHPFPEGGGLDDLARNFKHGGKEKKKYCEKFNYQVFSYFYFHLM